MTAPSEFGNLELNVTNLGPIARANVELRPMTVFVGPSNTGKSYLAVLIYALHRFFSGTVLDPRFSSPFRDNSIFGGIGHQQNPKTVSAEDAEALIGWAESLYEEVHEANRSEKAPVQLPEYVATMVRHQLEDVGDFAQSLDAEIVRCFGIETTGSLVRNGIEEGMSVVARRFVPEAASEADYIRYKYTIKGGKFDLDGSIPSTISLRADPRISSQFVRFLRYPANEIRRVAISSVMLSELADEYGPDLVSPLTRMSYYLPADRTGVMHAHKTIVRSLIGRASRAGLGPEPPLPALSGVLADFLETLIGLSERRPARRRRWKDLAGRLETEVLGGAILNRESVTGYPEFSYQPDGWERDLPLMHTSSMVSELAPVVLYLRHVVQAGETLIIEEPESHLHPAKQVEFIRHLSAVVRAGVRVIITTHSEWVLDELTNLVRLSKLSEQRREGIAGADYALSPDQLGVWLFEPKSRPKGSVVKEIPFDEDFGGFRSGFDEVATETYNDYAAISNRITEEAKPD